MSTSIRRHRDRVILGISILIAGITGCWGIAAAEPIRATSIFINENYRPGDGLPLGKIQAVQRGVFIVHAGQNEGYRAKAGLPVYKGDILVTNPKGRVLCRLNDGSKFSLAPSTKLTILRSSHNTAGKVSFSRLSLDTGLARFQLKPLAEFDSRQFVVRTNIAEIIAKEGDFIVRSHQEHTEVTAVVNSRLAVTGRDSPESLEDLSEFSRAVVEKGVFAARVESLSAELVDALISEIHPAPDDLLFDAARDKYGLPAEPEEEADKQGEGESGQDASRI